MILLAMGIDFTRFLQTSKEIIIKQHNNDATHKIFYSTFFIELQS